MSLKRFFKVFFVFLFFLIELQGQSINLKVIGKDSSQQSTIDSIGYKSVFKNFNSLSLEVDSLTQNLLRAGYIDVASKGPYKVNDSTFESKLDLGQQVKRVEINLNRQIPVYLKSKLNWNTTTDTLSVSIEQLEQVLFDLNSLLIEEGDPFSKLRLVNIRKKSAQEMSADLEVTSGRIRTIDKIIIKGYEKFPRSYLKHFLKIKEGDVFKLEALNTKSEQLSNLIFASQLREPEMLFTADSTILYLYLEKVPSNNFDGFLGFGTNEETNKLELDGYLNLQLINNLNFGEQLRLSYKSDEIDQQTFDIRLVAPYLFKSPIGLEAGLNIFRKDSSFVTTSQALNLNYQINPYNQIGLGINGTESSNLLNDESSIIQDYTNSFYTLSYNYIKPQFYDELFPINFLINFNFGQGKRDSDIEQLNQTKVLLNTYKLFNLNSRNIIYLRLNGAALISDNYLDNELFRFGGINSIRGFEENSLVANLYGVLNTEYRYRLSDNLFVNSVIDAAYFENQINSSQEKLFGFGFGFGLLTQAGLFRFNYASAKTEDQAFRLSNSKVHISLTATF